MWKLLIQRMKNFLRYSVSTVTARMIVLGNNIKSILMNKIIISIIVTVITFGLIFGLSALLDIAWINSEVSRKITVYILMVICFGIGFITFKAIFESDR